MDGHCVPSIGVSHREGGYLYEPLRLEELFEVSHLVEPHHDQEHHLAKLKKQEERHDTINNTYHGTQQVNRDLTREPPTHSKHAHSRRKGKKIHVKNRSRRKESKARQTNNEGLFSQQQYM